MTVPPLVMTNTRQGNISFLTFFTTILHNYVRLHNIKHSIALPLDVEAPKLMGFDIVS